MYYHLNILTNFIINHFLNDSTCLTILTNNLDTFNYDGELPHILINIDVDIPSYLLFRHYGCQGVVVINENPVVVFENLERALKLQIERNYNYRKYLFLPTKSQQPNLFKIFESPASNYVADIVVVYLSYCNLDYFGNEVNIFDLYTHKFVGPTKSMKDVIWLDRWYSVNRSFLLNQNLFFNKLDDQQGRAFRLATFTYSPFTIADPPDGVEMLCALEYAKKHNMTPEYIIDEEGQWGEAFDNWSGKGIIGNLAADKGDIGFAALYHWMYCFKFFDFSRPILRSGITCLVPAPKLASGFGTPFLSFSKEMWIMTAVSYFVMSVTIFLIYSISAKYENDRTILGETILKSIALSWRIILLQGFQKIPKLDQSKIVFSFTLILSLLLTTIYGSGLASIMMIPRYYGAIHDSKDIVNRNLPWGATDKAWTFSLRFDTRETSKKLVDLFVELDEEDLIKLSDKNFGYILEYLQGGNFAIPNHITLEGAQNRRPLDEDLFYEYCIFMMRKNSILLPSVNKLIYQITESGIIHYWEDQVVIRQLDKKTQKTVKDSIRLSKSGDVVIKLTFRHVEGAFAIWAIGLLVALCVFISELLKKNQINK